MPARIPFLPMLAMAAATLLCQCESTKPDFAATPDSVPSPAAPAPQDAPAWQAPASPSRTVATVASPAVVPAPAADPRQWARLRSSLARQAREMGVGVGAIAHAEGSQHPVDLSGHPDPLAEPVARDARLRGSSHRP